MRSSNFAPLVNGFNLMASDIFLIFIYISSILDWNCCNHRYVISSCTNTRCNGIHSIALYSYSVVVMGLKDNDSSTHISIIKCVHSGHHSPLYPRLIVLVILRSASFGVPRHYASPLARSCLCDWLVLRFRRTPCCLNNISPALPLEARRQAMKTRLRRWGTPKY